MKSIQLVSGARLGFKAITKARFFEVAEQYGMNRYLASDVWYFRTVSHLHDSEDQVRGNLELMKLDKWIEKNNELALRVERHRFAGNADNCLSCNGHHRLAVHNMGPVDEETHLKGITDGK